MKSNFLFFIIFPIMILMTKSVLSQDNNKLKIIDYLIEIGDLNPINKKDLYLDNVFIVDILTFEDGSKKEIGIFKFGSFADHSKVYILLKDDETFHILRLDKLDEDLLLELSFLRKLKLKSSESIKYIEGTIVEYQKNMKVIPWTE